MMNNSLQYQYSGDTRVDNQVEAYPSDPVIAAIPEGVGYAVAWQTYGDNGMSEIHYKRINPDGTVNGQEVLISQNDTDASAPAIVVTPNFSAITYVVEKEFGNELHMTLIDVASGQTYFTNEFANRVVSESIEYDESPAIAYLQDGGLVVGWTGTDGNIHTAQYDFNGNLYQGSDVTITVPEGATNPSITPAADGHSYVVSYGTHEGNVYAIGITPQIHQDPVLGDVYEDYLVTPRIDVVTDNSAGIEGMVMSSVTALADGTFVAIWNAPNMVEQGIAGGISGDGDGFEQESGSVDMVMDGFNVYLKHFDVSGQMLGEVEMVNTVTGINNLDPHVTALGDGGYVVVWRANGNDDGDIVARRYDAHWHPLDSEFTINANPYGLQTAPAVAAQLVGTGFATVWADEGHNNDFGTQLPGIEVSVEINQIPVFSSQVTEADAVSGGPEINLNALLAVNDADWNQRLDWSIGEQPAHGTLTFLGAGAWSGAQPGITPEGSITYQAAPGYVGSDVFSVIVFDGERRVERTITVNVTAPLDPVGPGTGSGDSGNVAPGTPVLSESSDSGAKDGIATNANSVTYSGSAGYMVDSEMTDTEVYVDVNGNGRYDGEDEPGTFADNVNGSYSGSIDVGSLADGTYTVYAQNNWFGSENYKSQTTLTIDRTGPEVLSQQAHDFNIRTGSMTFTITYDEAGSGLDPASVGGSNVVVVQNSAPYVELKVEVQSIDGNKVTYTAVPQDDSWDQADAGTYGIYVVRGVEGVHDKAGNTMTQLPDEVFAHANYNEAPVLGGIFSVNSIDDRHTAKPFSGVTVSDADSDLVSIRIVFHGANGTLSGEGLEGANGEYVLDAADLATLQQRLQKLVFTPAAVQSSGEPEVRTSFTLTALDADGPGLSNNTSKIVVTAAPVTVPTTPSTPSQPADPVTHSTVDGVSVNTSTTIGGNGKVNAITDVPVIVTSRVDDPTSTHAALADIPLGVTGANGIKVDLTVSLPTGAGMRAESSPTLLSNQQALLDLIARIENKTASGSDVQTRMSGQGGDFLGKLDQAVLLQTATLTPILATDAATKTIMITGSSVSHVDGSGNASAIGLVIDASQLPSSAVLQLNNVDFAAIVGAATLRGGDGQNYVVGDDAAQNILLGADDDVLFGGGGNDIVGSAGGNDTLDGGSGNDAVVGGIGNDSLFGGTGNDVLQGGRSDQGAWKFMVGADGTLAASHELALFAPGTSENVTVAELDLANSGLSFANVASARLVDLALVYDAVLGRAPDLAGINFWADNAVNAKDVAAYMIESSEWMSSSTAALSDADFVQQIYTHALGRAADTDGLAFWVGKLDTSAGVPELSRAGVLTAIAFSDEHRAHLGGDSGVISVASGALSAETGWFANSGDDVLEGGAGSDVLVGGDGNDTIVYSGALDGYKIVLNSAGQVQVEDRANGDLDTISGIEAGSFAGNKVDLGFTQASEAQLETLGMLYHAVLDRSADLAGMNWWASLDLDQAGLVNGIVNSDEYRAQYADLDDAGFVNALFQAAGLDADAAGGLTAWQDYLSTHTRAELIGAWVSNDTVIEGQQGVNGLWLV